jgi:hypothetical protein
LSEDFIGTIAESKTMVSRSLEKMMLIAIGLSTAVIVGVPVLMYAIETLNTTTELQEVQMAAEQIHNGTMIVDGGVTNSTTFNVWINQGVTVSATGHSLTVLHSPETGSPTTWTQSYLHDVVIAVPLETHRSTTLYTVEIDMIDGIIYISFYAVPI